MISADERLLRVYSLPIYSDGTEGDYPGPRLVALLLTSPRLDSGSAVSGLRPVRAEKTHGRLDQGEGHPSIHQSTGYGALSIGLFRERGVLCELRNSGIQ